MRTIAQSALTVSLASALLAGCGGSLPSVGASGAMSVYRIRIAPPHYQVLHSFGGPHDGKFPQSSLIDVKGTLYGTTDRGGKPQGGTVFSISPSGTEHVLYSFSQIHHGKQPDAGLIEVNGTLYGTTANGGAHNGGTVFSVSMSGRQRVLHSFDDKGKDSDGSDPQASLIDVNGRLYGTTAGGGKYGGGTVFSVTTNGTEKVLHSFGKGSDGFVPSASLTNLNGTLYGTTSGGGPGCGCGTVFSITTSGKEKVLYSFAGGSDGQSPLASLIEVSGTLYGTTGHGGTYRVGTVFSITTSGTEHVVYSFGSRRSDGGFPVAGLVDVDGALYGTTFNGGRYDGGTIFSVSTSGTEKLLHSFGRRLDGSIPEASLFEMNGTLYGTTNEGGTYERGTVFALTP